MEVVGWGRCRRDDLTKTLSRTNQRHQDGTRKCLIEGVSSVSPEHC